MTLTAVKREKFANKKKTTKKCFKGKVVIFTVPNLILCQYPDDLLTFLTLLRKFQVFENGEIRNCWRHLSQQFSVRHLKVKKSGYVREMRIHLHSTQLNSYYIYILAHVSTSL